MELTPLITKERKPVRYIESEQEWTYESIRRVFPEGEGTLVDVLVKRRQELERIVEMMGIPMKRRKD